MSSLRLVRTAGHAVVACLVAVACLWTLPAHAADQTVELHDNEFRPAVLTVAAGDTITWLWRGENPHGVRVVRSTEEGTEQVYESHEGCGVATPEACGTQGTSKRWKPSEPGDYRFYCPVHGTEVIGMTGTLTVEPAPSPDPNETTSPSPTPSPSPSPKAKSADPTPSPTQQEPEPETGSSAGDDGGTDAGSTSSSSESPRPRRTQGTASNPGITYGPPEPVSPEPMPTIRPSVAPSQSPTADVDEPDLEDFPEAPQASSTEEETGVVAIDAPRGPTPRSVWLGLGSASILASAGAFLKLVLFGAPWS